MVDGGDLAFDRETLPVTPVGWRADEEETPDLSERLNVLEIK